MTVQERIESRLTGMGIPYRVTTHAPVYTSAEAAAARGASLAAGAKALIVKAGEEFVLFVVPGDRRMDSKAVKRILGIRVISLAHGRLDPARSALRTLLLCLVVPPLVFDRDQRGLHDKAAGSVAVRMGRPDAA